MRLTRVLEGIVRAIFFHHFSQKWLGRITTHAEFLLNTLDPEAAVEENKVLEEKTIASEQLFHDKPYFGENPGVIKYQVVGEKDNVEQIFRLHFYIGCRVTALLVGDGDG